MRGFDSVYLPILVELLLPAGDSFALSVLEVEVASTLSRTVKSRYDTAACAIWNLPSAFCLPSTKGRVEVVMMADRAMHVLQRGNSFISERVASIAKSSAVALFPLRSIFASLAITSSLVSRRRPKSAWSGLWREQE